MVSPIPPILQHVYVIMRLQISENSISIARSVFCHYGDTDDIFLIGGLARQGETITTSTIRQFRHLVNFLCSQNVRLYLAKVLNGLMDHEPIKYRFMLWIFF
jgi:hypothetical protein